MIKLLAFDLDKTLLNDQGRVSLSDKKVLQQLDRQGKIIVISSGRMTDSIRPFAQMIEIDTPIVAYNGGMARSSQKQGNHVLYHQPLPPQYGDTLIDYCRKNHYHLNYYLDDKLYADQDSSLRQYSTLYANQTQSVFHFVPSLEQFKGKQPTKLILITEPINRDRLHDAFHAEFGNEINVVKTNPHYLEFMHLKATKGNGIHALAKHYGIKREETMAFGDADNDLPMLEYAGTAVAVANAYDHVKAVADYVTTATNNQNPVTETVEKLGL